MERRGKAPSGKFEPLSLDLPFGRLVGVAAGPPEGPPVLAIHGWNARGEFFQPLISACIRQGLRVYAFDMPAHGQTRDANPHKPSSTLVEWVETLIALTAALRVDAWRSIVAHSFGGLAACFAMGPRPWPGLPPLSCKSLALIAGASGMPTVIESYAAAMGSSEADIADIIRGVERATSAKLAALAIAAVSRHLPERILLIHDPEDETARLADLKYELAGRAPSDELIRPKAGHDGILFQLEVGRAVARFAAG